MVTEGKRRDLVALVADSNIEETLKGLLLRYKSLDIRPITFTIFRHPERDPGCFLRAHDFLRSMAGRYRHAIVVFDREGCGRETTPREGLEADLDERLAKDWQGRARAVVLEPELEAWMWGPSPHVEAVLGWKGREPRLRDWLEGEGFVSGPGQKPPRPKEAVEKALRMVRKPRSSALYGELARKASFQRCIDPAFVHFREVLAVWFSRHNMLEP